MTLIRKQTSIPIQKETDVCVIGGGPAGIGAAVAAARHNKHVILIEKRGFTGGNVTACYVENPDYFMAGTQFAPEGIYAEIESGFLSKFGNDNVRPKKNKSFNSETLKCYLDDYLLSNGIQLMLHSFVNDVICEDDVIRAVIIQTKKGPAAITAKTFIDTTGDGDVAYAAGVPCDIGRDMDGKCQPGTVAVRLAGANVKELLTDGDKLQKITKEFRAEYQKGNIQLTCKRQDIPFGRLTKAGIISYVNYSCAYDIDPTDNEDLTRGEIECRKYILEIVRYLKTHYAELRDIEIASIAPEIGFRDSRRIHGNYRLTIEDMEAQKHFQDAIAVFPRFYDMLSPDGIMSETSDFSGKGYHGHIFEPVIGNRYFEVPYRCMVPDKINNMLVAGRCVSADHVAECGLRAVSLCTLMGQAAGTAGALAVDNQVSLSNIPIKTLQKQLINDGIKIPMDQD